MNISKIKTYETYLFDLDGTLIDTTEMILQCFLHTLGPYENETVKISEKAILSSIGRPFFDQLDIFFESNHLEKPDYAMLAKKHMEYQGKIWNDYLKVFAEVPKVLQQLSQSKSGQKKKLAVVTSRKMPSATTFMRHVGIENFFPLLVTPELTKAHKPSPEPAEYAMEKLKADKESTLFIGDSRFDIGCADAAGIDSFLVRRKEAEVMWSDNELNRMSPKPTYVELDISNLV